MAGACVQALQGLEGAVADAAQAGADTDSIPAQRAQLAQRISAAEHAHVSGVVLHAARAQLCVLVIAEAQAGLDAALTRQTQREHFGVPLAARIGELRAALAAAEEAFRAEPELHGYLCAVHAASDAGLRMFTDMYRTPQGGSECGAFNGASGDATASPSKSAGVNAARRRALATGCLAHYSDIAVWREAAPSAEQSALMLELARKADALLVSLGNALPQLQKLQQEAQRAAEQQAQAQAHAHANAEQQAHAAQQTQAGQVWSLHLCNVCSSRQLVLRMMLLSAFLMHINCIQRQARARLLETVS